MTSMHAEGAAAMEHHSPGCDFTDHRTLLGAVADCLALNPLETSEALCRRHGLSLDGLLHCYRLMRESSEVRMRWANSPRAEFFQTADQILSRMDVVERILADQFVFPLFIEFHSGGMCPIQCTFCYNDGLDHFKSRHSRAQMMDGPRLVALVDDAADEGTLLFYIAGGGEPMSDPRIWPALKRARERGMITILNTMGGHLKRAGTVENILGSVSHIRVSLNSTDPAAYRIVSRTSDDRMFHRVIAGLRDLVDRRDAAQSPLRITLSFVLYPDSWSEIEAMAELGASIGVDEVYVRQYYDGAKEQGPDLVGTIEAAQERLLVRESKGHFGRTRIRVGLSLDTEPFDSPFRAAIHDSDCLATRFKIGIDAWGNIHRCSLVAQPGVGGFNFTIGNVLEAGSLRQALEPAIAEPREPVSACNEKGIYCSNFEAFFNGLMTKLRRDRDFGVPLCEQPFLPPVNAENGRWFNRRTA